jgi:hypothetical protein
MQNRNLPFTFIKILDDTKLSTLSEKKRLNEIKELHLNFRENQIRLMIQQREAEKISVPLTFMVPVLF